MKAHPVADLFPMMSESELRELGEDIKANGLREPIVVDDTEWLKQHPRARGHKKQYEWQRQYERAIDSGEILIVDGRNRYTVCKLAGLPWTHEASSTLEIGGHWIDHRPLAVDTIDGDVINFILSKNIHRRHLTRSKQAKRQAGARKGLLQSAAHLIAPSTCGAADAALADENPDGAA